jgi:CopG antitoxin of type II toxin-antitoxin system
MEESMSEKQLPKTDSIEELAKFWDSHDLTDFEDELEEVTEQLFEPAATFTVQLDPAKADAMRQLAESQGLPASDLIQLWVNERIDSTRLDQSI